ncbi:GTP-binding protein [Campylobacter hyointestinalis subsp. hyointestinalis]|uniref:GTP-binding protein n=1 Tax=Campylobacter hyointestinalis subsp. hyointestinalis TaxID=91352 RepID=A0A0S4SG44_CAMHY|nr:dynamin family protein [Campylobacter hyointestinalis]CUU84817.1 GTP-binding protein [Campylobacter hyointestinalis subsp. hyointestinalis]
MNDFLEQIWGVKKLYIDPNFSIFVDEQTASAILSVSAKNYDRYILLESFKTIFDTVKLELNEYSVQLMQVGILNAIINLKIKLDEVLNGLEELRKNDILDFVSFKFISEYLSNLKLVEKQNSVLKKEDLTFYKNINSLNLICNELKALDESHIKRLENAENSANNSKFYIAVTGVINAGKSSTLNAMIGKKILGVSNVPETANLSVITYSKDEFAKAVFWSGNEQESMGLEPKKLQDLKVDVSELVKYTGASSPLAPYVKQVILGVDLPMLEDGINIVDTPGLDDAVILREELTKAYMQESDFTLHLMNGAQSATKKDMSFIVNTLKNSKSGGLIVVLTHIDKLSSNDQAEVLEYTKKSIAAELKEYGFDESLALDVKFFLVSAVKNIGIENLKNYLYESFFGSNSKKANLIIENYKKELLHITRLIKEDVDFKLRMLGGNRVLAKETMENLKLSLSNLEEDLNSLKAQMNEFIKKLDYSFSELSSLKSISSKIKNRIISDVKYARDRKQKVNFDRLGVICESGFNDMFIDLFREFGVVIAKDINSLYETARIKFNSDNFTLNLPKTKEYLDKNLPKISFTQLKQDLFSTVKNVSDMEILSQKLTTLFDEFIVNLNLPNELKKLSLACSKEFMDGLQASLHQTSQSLKSKEKELLDMLSVAKADEAQHREDRALLESKFDKLEEIYNRISTC